MEERVHIGISVKDFKSIVLHAETLKASITSRFSHPSRPMQLTYREHGIQCEFTLMTTGEYRGDSVTPAPTLTRNASVMSNHLQSHQSTGLQRSTVDQEMSHAMPPPVQPASRSFGKEPPSQRPSRPSPPPPKPSVDEESLFVSQGDDEPKWGESNFDDDVDILGWDASAKNVRKSLHQW